MSLPKAKQNVIPQMFDIRPTTRSGSLDMGRIQKVNLEKSRAQEYHRQSYSNESVAAPKYENIKAFGSESFEQPLYQNREQRRVTEQQSVIIQLGQTIKSQEAPYFVKVPRVSRPSEHVSQEFQNNNFPEPNNEPTLFEQSNPVSEEESLFKRLQAPIPREIPRKQQVIAQPSFAETILSLFQKRFVYAPIVAILAGVLIFKGVTLVQSGMQLKGQVLGVSQNGFDHLKLAGENIKGRQFNQSDSDFQKAFDEFSTASKSLDDWNSALVDISGYVPFMSPLSSGKNALEAGQHFALAGQKINTVLDVVSEVKNPLDTNNGVSLTEVLKQTTTNVEDAKNELIAAQENLENVDEDDIPEEKRDRFIQAKTQLPVIIEGMQAFLDHSHILTDLLGGNGPRKYLFLFQNNHEMRATGGFIGSYGLLDISNGRVRNFFIDGIFNPDGQLKEDIIPPTPLQKVSAGWSLHDSNWFPDFPTSAEKAISFYEKTGGPTVDGVITLTPTVMQKMLRMTGPIYMEKYDVTLDADNFIENVQTEVEVEYDKEENKPKQILADLAPILLDRVLNAQDAENVLEMAKALEEGMNEKHILVYSRNAELEKIIDDAGWSGRMLDANKDYLSVINSNINGYKTDGVVDETIKHQAEIQSDGSVIDTVTVTRKHNGGDTDKEWWNKVNANYMRVYVPQGSKLISAEGYTREVVSAPLDYEKLGFRKDALVESEEQSIVLDEATGTRVYDEDGKTVFGNWVYVSPKEAVTVTYKYLLPFKVNPLASENKGFDSYSIVFQKQSGSLGSHLVSSISFPENIRSVWQSSKNLVLYGGAFEFKQDLIQDQFLGIVFDGK